MRTVDRYIARSFLGSYLILLGVFAGLYISVDLMVNLDEFTKDPDRSFGQVLGLMADFYGNNLPLYYSQIGGMVLGMAAAFTLGYMLRNNELTALVAAGVPLQRLLTPMVVVAAMLLGLWLANRELLIPAMAEKIARTKDDVIGQRTTGVHCARDDHNAILTAAALDPLRGQLHRVRIIEPDEHGRPRHLIEADAATYDAAARTWRLQRGRRISQGDPKVDEGLGQGIHTELLDEYPFTLGPDQLVLRRASQWADLLSTRQLNALLETRNLANRPTIDMSRHIRLTQPLVFGILMLLIAPFFLTREPVNVLVVGGKALLMSGTFFLITFVAQSTVDESYSALLAWIPILAFGPVAALLVGNVKT